MIDLGKIYSHPNANGEHKLKCPSCHNIFRSKITKDDSTNEMNSIICEACGYKDEPLVFVYQVNKDQNDKMALDYAQQEMKQILRKAFRGNKNIRIK